MAELLGARAGEWKALAGAALPAVGSSGFLACCPGPPFFYSLSEQVEGVRFLYEATMGLRTPGMQGCILADEMVRV